VWEKRIEANTGVVWTRPFTAESQRDISLIDETSLIALEDGQLIGLDESDGTVRWRHAVTETVSTAIMSADQSLLFTADRRGQIAAYPLLDDEDGLPYLPADPAWTTELELFGSPTLLPLPEGGVAIMVWQEMAAVAADGTLLWQDELEKRPFDWLLTENELILTLTGRNDPIYSVTESGLEEWAVGMNGRPVPVGDDIWFYAREGVYRLNTAAQTTELLYQLPPSFMGMGSIIALPTGGAMLAHQDLDDSRLIAFNADGTVQWQRSYRSLEAESPQLLLHDDRPYLLLQSGSNMSVHLDLYAIDQESSALRHIFTGGTRQPLVGGNWAVSINDDLLLINIGGGSMVALDVATAVAP
jgi:outer membrane protein assembly factor BamB